MHKKKLFLYGACILTIALYTTHGHGLLSTIKEKILHGVSTVSDQLKYYKNRVQFYLKQVNNQAYKDLFLKKSRYYNLNAMHVTERISLTQEEKTFIQNRAPIVANALSQFLHTPYTPDRIPHIGVALSGGGYRAMILSSGFMKGLELIGLSNALMYTASLSGSTWFIGPWVFSHALGNETGSIDFYYQRLREKFKNGAMNITDRSAVMARMNMQYFQEQWIFPKLIFKEPIGLIDVYGVLLTDAILADHRHRRYVVGLEDQTKSVLPGIVPFPIYTAISMHKIHEREENYFYNWYEFNPFFIRNIELNLMFPTVAFNSKFNKAQLTTDTLMPSLPFGNLMAIFGSAFNANLSDIYKIIHLIPQEIDKEFAIQKSMSAAEKVKKKLFKTAMETLAYESPLQIRSRTGLTKKRAIDTLINNPFKNMNLGQPWLENRKQLRFVDAGISYNIPIKPLFDEARKVEFIIIGDASGNALESSAEIYLALKDIQKTFGITYIQDTRIHDQEETFGYVSPTCIRVYRPEKKEKAQRAAPIIVYVNFAKDPALFTQAENSAVLKSIIETYDLKTFNPEICVEKECSTLSFNYSAKSFDQLSGIGILNIVAHKKLFEALLNNQ